MLVSAAALCRVAALLSAASGRPLPALTRPDEPRRQPGSVRSGGQRQAGLQSPAAPRQRNITFDTSDSYFSDWTAILQRRPVGSPGPARPLAPPVGSAPPRVAVAPDGQVTVLGSGGAGFVVAGPQVVHVKVPRPPGPLEAVQSAASVASGALVSTGPGFMEVLVPGGDGQSAPPAPPSGLETGPPSVGPPPVEPSPVEPSPVEPSELARPVGPPGTAGEPPEEPPTPSPPEPPLCAADDGQVTTVTVTRRNQTVTHRVPGLPAAALAQLTAAP